MLLVLLFFDHDATKGKERKKAVYEAQNLLGSAAAAARMAISSSAHRWLRAVATALVAVAMRSSVV
jgi:hypothetical protein